MDHIPHSPTSKSVIPTDKHLLLFDGVCNLCNKFVQAILLRDKEAHFVFASLQSPIGMQFLQAHHLPLDLKTVVLISNGKAYTKSDAPLEIGKILGIWPFLLFFFRWIPKRIRDIGYSIIATNRYRLFGKKDYCLLPQPKWKKRFLDA